MFDLYNSSGYDLYQPFAYLDQWVIDGKDGLAYYGTLKEVVKYMTQKLDFYFDDVEDGLTLLADNVGNGHNGVHYGCRKTAIFTFEKENKYERQAS